MSEQEKGLAKTFHYRGLEGSAEVSIEDGCLHGKILWIKDLVTYEGDTVSELEGAFHFMADEYLADQAKTKGELPRDERDKDLGHNAPTRTRLDIAQAEYNMAKQGFEDLADDPAYLPLVAFWLATSVEMGLRHMFDVAGMDQPKTHDVDQLIRLAHEQNIDLFLPRYIEGHAEMFTLWVERKDDLKYEIEKDKIERAFNGVDEYFTFIDLGMRYGQVFTTDLRHEKAAQAAVEAIKNSDFRVNVKSVFLFGSCARGTQGEWSDVDFGIITRPGLLDDEQIKEEYFNLVSDMQSKDWDSADVEPHIFYDGEWENRKSNEYIKRDLKTIWENPDYV